MTKRQQTPFHTAKPSAQRHAERIERDAKAAKWVKFRREKDGKYIPYTKGER
jgi:hypothetical protein